MGLFGPKRVRALEDKHLTQFVDDVIALAQLAEKEFEDIKDNEKRLWLGPGAAKQKLAYEEREHQRRIEVRVEFFRNVIARAKAKMKDAEEGKFDQPPGAD